MNQKIKELIKTIPHSPGCYRYFNSKGELIYIGKAKDLKKRVYSYFVGANDTKTTVLVENIADIKWEVTESEIEALILESLLIKRYKPKFNIKVKDDKDFLWVKIDMGAEFPMPELVRRYSVGANGRSPVQEKIKYFGPFTDSRLLKQGLTILRKIFLWRDCSESKFSFYKKKGKPCLEYYIKNCSAPCQVGCKQVSCKLVSKNDSQLETDINNKSLSINKDYQKGIINNKELISNKNDYQIGIKQLITFLKGGKKKIINDMERKMRALSKKKKYEEAAEIRDKVRSLQHIDASLKISEARGEGFKSQMSNNKLQTNDKYQISNIKYLENFLKILNDDLGCSLKFKPNFRIEFYDISNTSGSEAVGSMVVWQDGGFARGEYRKFKIKTVRGPNDVGMMREVLDRRIKQMTNAKSGIHPRLDQREYPQIQPPIPKKDISFSKKPDLIVLDGGKPQLSEIAKLFNELKIDIPLLSLAKEEEEVFGINLKSQITNTKQITNHKSKNKIARYQDNNYSTKFKLLDIKKSSPEGFFLQVIRDEAHRFAITYHKKLRSKGLIRSRLDDIDGIGPAMKKKLLLKFGSVDGIIKASIDDVADVVGKKMAGKLKEVL